MPTDHVAAIRRALTEINTGLKANTEPGSELAIAQAAAISRLIQIHIDLEAVARNLRTWQPGPSETKDG